MRRWKRVGMVVLVAILATIPAAAAESAKSLFKKGQDAEVRQNYEAAYNFYQQAYQQKPREMSYRVAMTRTRFLAAAAHVHRGQQLREQGKLQEALAEFQAAKQIDPASTIADQEIKRTNEAIERLKRAPSQPPPSPSGLSSLAAQAGGPVELAPISNTPITLKLSEDSKVIYETIGKLAGINVLFDPDYTSRRIRIELNNVSLYEALQIYGPGIENLLAAGYPQHHLCRRRYQEQAQRIRAAGGAHLLPGELEHTDRHPGRYQYLAYPA